MSNYGHANFVHSIVILGLGEGGGLAVWSPQTASAPVEYVMEQFHEIIVP